MLKEQNFTGTENIEGTDLEAGDITGNTITFTATSRATEYYYVKDAAGKKATLMVQVKQALDQAGLKDENNKPGKVVFNIVVGETLSYNYLINQSIYDYDNIQLDGQPISDGTVEATTQPVALSKFKKAIQLTLTGTAEGTSTITLTDGIGEVEITVNVVAPKPLVVKEGATTIAEGAEINITDNLTFEVAEGTGAYTVSVQDTNSLLQTPIAQPTKDANTGKTTFTLTRNTAVTTAAEATVTVTDSNNGLLTRTFKVKFAPTAKKFAVKFSIGGTEVKIGNPKADSSLKPPYCNDAYLDRYGHWLAVKVGTTIDAQVEGGKAPYTVTTMDNETVQVTAVDASGKFQIITKKVDAKGVVKP